MYDNIGKKIKGLAKATFFIEAFIAIIAGIVLMASDEELILIGFLVMIVCTFIAWVTSWTLYGFGELVDKTCDIERNTRGAETKVKPQENMDFERINKIEKLRFQGLITEEEYQQAINKVQQ